MKCPDCPQLDASRMPVNWKPREKCCSDDIEIESPLKRAIREARGGDAPIQFKGFA